MARSTVKTIRVPNPLLDALDLLRAPGGPLAAYPSNSAAIVGLIVYAIAFPRPHELTAGLAGLPQEHQDLVHDFLLAATQARANLREMTPKPATADDLLDLAKRWAQKRAKAQ